MCLHVSHDCNLRCRYCFAGQGIYGGKPQTMPFEVAKAAIDFLVAQSGPRRHLELDFFGGEPLLNLGVVKQTVAYARGLEKEHDKAFRFTMTTNGVLLDEETTAFLNAEMQNVVLSLDGRKDINDAMRPNAGGKGSYDTIVPRYQRFVAQRGDRDYYVRGTFTPVSYTHLDVYKRQRAKCPAGPWHRQAAGSFGSPAVSHGRRGGCIRRRDRKNA